MKKLCYISLMFIVTFISCENGFDYPTYMEGENRVAQLLLKDSLYNKAHILDYNGDLWAYHREQKDVVEKIADFYNIHGYEIFLYDTLRYNFTKLVDRSFEECLNEGLMIHNDHIPAYDYRMNYVDEKGDTIGKLLWRYEGEGILYTPTILEETELNSIIQYFQLEHCRIYDHKINDLYSKKWEKGTQYIGCYAYSIGNSILFRDRTKDVIQIDNITIKLTNETSQYLRYYSNEELNFKQILKALKEIGLPKSIVYFHKYFTELEYASAVYFKSKDWYNIGMFTINKSYRAQYNQTTSLWETKDISIFK